MTALAHAFVRPLVRAQCVAVRDAALRVASAEAQAHLDADAIHDHRVAIRRLRTLLGASKPLFKRGALDRVLSELRGLAQAAGAVRDEEVLAETLAAIDLPKAIRLRLDTWIEKRARCERELRLALIAQLAPAPHEARDDAPGLAEVLALAEEVPVRRKAMALPARALAEKAVGQAGAKVVEGAAQVVAESPDALHELRIRFKRLRYTVELFSKAIAADGAAAATLSERMKAATRMQKRLGDLHDVDEALAHISGARALDPGDRMVVLHHLRTGRAALLARIEKELPAALALLGTPDGSDAASPLA
jgi:CHAD domain-containing protein